MWDIRVLRDRVSEGVCHVYLRDAWSLEGTVLGSKTILELWHCWRIWRSFPARNVIYCAIKLGVSPVHTDSPSFGWRCLRRTGCLDESRHNSNYPFNCPDWSRARSCVSKAILDTHKFTDIFVRVTPVFRESHWLSSTASFIEVRKSFISMSGVL